MKNVGTNNSVESAVGFTQTLILTFGQDAKGFLFRHSGRLLLFILTCTSVIAVFLIFLFVALAAMPFLGKINIGEFLTSTQWYPTQDIPEYGALALIVGSFYVTTAALTFAVPVP